MIKKQTQHIYFKEITPGEVKKTISLNEAINIDLDIEGKTIGIEVLNASKNLPKAAFATPSNNPTPG